MGCRLILLQFMLATSMFAQGYYPLAVGNSWEYYGTLIPVPPAYDHTAAIVGDTLLANGHTYAIERTTTNIVRLLRQDGDQILQYLPSGDSLIFDFSLRTNDTLRVQYIEPSPGEFDPLITMVAEVTADWFGRQWRSWRFETVSTKRGAWRSELIADSLGLISFYDDIGDERVFYCGGARIDNVQYGTISDTPPDLPSHPTQMRLHQNFPNPFNPETVIRFSLPAGQAGLLVSGHVAVRVYDLLGREVATIVNAVMPAGEHAVRWDASGMPGGVYVARLICGRSVDVIKLMLMK